MKLIDILVEELPKRGGWPKHAEKYCSYNGETGAYKRGGIEIKKALITGIDTQICEVVCAEQYEAALAAKNEGWIEWGGSENPPVSTNTVVDVRLRCGSVTVRQPAGIMNWRSNAPDEPSDIIAYRLHQTQEAEQDKADLSECASQDAAPVLNGEGLPPVGMKVEWLSDKYGWLGGTVAAHDAKYPLVAIISHNDGYTGCHRHELRTEAERKRDAAVEIMTQILCSPNQASATAKKNLRSHCRW